MTDSRKLRGETLYKISAITGIVIVLLAGYTGWTNITQLEPRAIAIFEQHILASLDARSLNTQTEAIEYAITQSRAAHPEHGLDYSESELDTLEQEAVLLREQLNEQLATLTRLDAEKRSIVIDIKITLIACILALTIGMVFAVFGFVAWYFHIQILEDRRTTPRT